MTRISSVAALLILATSSLMSSSCKKDEKATEATESAPEAAEETSAAEHTAAEPTSTDDAGEATPQQMPKPEPVEDAPDEYKAIAEATLAIVAKRDFDAFVSELVLSKEGLRSMFERSRQACPQLAAEFGAMEQMFLSSYEPGSDPVKEDFEACTATNFKKAKVLSISAREHTVVCGQEAADHVEITVKVGKEDKVLVLDDLVKTPDGWRSVDGGVRCR